MSDDTEYLEWEAVGQAEEWEEGKGRLITIGARRIGVYLVDGDFFAIKDICPHAGAPLHEGPVINGAAVCPLHGWAFDLKTGEGPGCSVATYAVRISESGQVEISY